MAQAIVWNHFTKGHLKAGRTLHRLHETFHVPEIPVAVLASIVFGAIGFSALYYGLHALHVQAVVYASHGSVWNRTENIWRSGWDKKAMGYGAALVARRPMQVIFDDAQKWFAQRRASLGKGTCFYQPPTFQARVNDLSKIVQEVHSDAPPPGGLRTTLQLGGLVVGLVLTGYGFYVLTFVA